MPCPPPLTLIAARLPGETDYATAWALQRALHAEVAAEHRDDTLLLLEHPPTITMGRRGGWSNLRTPPASLDARGFQRWQIDRGGDITFHGPGQLVGYPILNMRRANLALGDMLRALEQAHIDALAHLGLAATRLDGFPGVWCGPRKITAVGLRITRHTTQHGFALNVNTDLDGFAHIIPCGLDAMGVTSLAHELGAPQDLDAVAHAIAARLALLFNHTLTWRDPQTLPWPPPDEVAAIRAAHLVTSTTDTADRAADPAASLVTACAPDAADPAASLITACAPAGATPR